MEGREKERQKGRERRTGNHEVLTGRRRKRGRKGEREALKHAHQGGEGRRWRWREERRKRGREGYTTPVSEPDVVEEIKSLTDTHEIKIVEMHDGLKRQGKVLVNMRRSCRASRFKVDAFVAFHSARPLKAPRTGRQDSV